MNRSKRRAWLLVCLASLASPLCAHAPYERVKAKLTDPSGRPLQVVARYTDGLIGADPVTIAVRDSAGASVAATDAARDAIVRCPSFTACRVYLYEPPFSILPARIVRLEPGGFVPESARRQWIIGTFLPISEHLLELVVESVALAIVPVAAQLLARRRRTPITIAAWPVLAVAGILWLSFWGLGILLNTVISIAWVAVAVGALAALPALIRGVWRRGLTMGWS